MSKFLDPSYEDVIESEMQVISSAGVFRIDLSAGVRWKICQDQKIGPAAGPIVD